MKNLNIDRDHSNNLRAIAILAVLVGHGLARLTDSQVATVNYAGGIGVAIFLMLSGYGLCESYQIRGNLKGFWKKRVETVLIPYWVAMVIQSLLDYLILGRRLNLKAYLLSFACFNDYTSFEGIDSTMWYITFLLFCYVIFFVVFSFKFSIEIKAIFLFLVFAVFYQFDLYLNGDWCINYLRFPIGVLFSVYKNCLSEKVLRILNAISLLLCVTSSSGYYSLDYKKSLLIYCISGGVFFLTLQRYFEDNKFLKEIGEASYAIYLVEGAILERYVRFYNVEGSFMDMIIFWIASVEIGVACHYVFIKLKSLPPLCLNRCK